MWNPFNPPPAPPAFGKGQVVPEEHAFFLSRLVFEWISPLLGVGFSRPLDKEDLWDLPSQRLTASLSDDLEHRFYARCPPRNRPAFLQPPDAEVDEKSDEIKSVPIETVEGASSPSPVPKKRFWSFFRRRGAEGAHDDDDSRYDSSLFKALNSQFFYSWWFAGLLKLGGDTLRTTTPIVSKIFLNWLVKSYLHHRAPSLVPKVQGIGYGIGVGIGLFAMQEASSLLINHHLFNSMTVGLLARASLIGVIFRKSLRLSGRARSEHSVGQITTLISSDTVRLERAAWMGHRVWVAPIQIAIGIGLLVSNLGYSALVGLGILLLGFPFEFILVRIMFKQRKKGVVLTDARVKLTTEVLQGIRLIKFYAWEAFYAHKIGELRAREIRTLKIMAISRSALIALITFLPVLAAVMSFITYALTGHDLNVATIFASLQLFNIIRMPLMTFPFVFAVVAESIVSLSRISKLLVAEELQSAGQPELDYSIDDAVDVDGDFVWETIVDDADDGKGKGKGKSKGKDKKAKKRNQGDKRKDEEGRKPRRRLPWRRGGQPESLLPTSAAEAVSGPVEKPESSDGSKENPFELRSLRLRIPRGAFVAIVGTIGSGKSSILQALIGEMRKTRGKVVLGGTVAYVPQSAWIQNATVRENVTFGQEDDDEKFWSVVGACCLEQDLNMLPNGEKTEIGEKGINLSGGQKARVSLARAAYNPSDIVLLDDPLSAVDAHVGNAILENCILSGPLSERTRILVTHALHFLDKVDRIYVVDKGSVVDEGTYEELMGRCDVFSHLMHTYGHLEEEGEEADIDGGKDADKATSHKADDGKKDDILMQVEERNIGAVPWSVYAKYLKFAGGISLAPIILGLLAFGQASQVGNVLFLGFWTAGSIPGFKQGEYMGVYGALGGAQALASFFLSVAFAFASLGASLTLFKAALNGVLRSPASFFDTIPMGKILSRLSKDQDVLDTELSMTMFQFMITAVSIVGTIALIFYVFPLLGTVFLPMGILYYLVSSYYRRTSIETKRLESISRSALYSSFSETLTGLPTVRAYGAQTRAVRKADDGMDSENRAHFATVAIQRWLGVRLDFFANILVLGISLFAAGFRTTVNPSKIGVVLSYTLGITSFFSDLVTFFAQNEQNMNAVERVLVYSDLPPEGAAVTPNDPPTTWPQNGQITFTKANLAYRPGLPLVLKSVSFEVKPGEKIGIVGRTGAGKSSLLQALFRIVDLQDGKIEIDGYNIRDIGLDVLRERLALVPQDAVMFSGTLRDNLDPRGSSTDAEMLSALQRTWLLPREGPADPVAEAKFSLDSAVGDEGSNYSAGEKQLLALCRALIKNSRIIVLDEATSSVDVATDSKLQKTIQTEFTKSTLLCIAHRLNTIAYYDRVLVMDNGWVAEFDTVLNLFDDEKSIFRSLCNEAGLSRHDIVRIRSEVATTSEEAGVKDV